MFYFFIVILSFNSRRDFLLSKKKEFQICKFYFIIYILIKYLQLLLITLEKRFISSQHLK